MQDDYGINLEEAASGERGARSRQSIPSGSRQLPAPRSPADRDAVEREIAQLRDQINNIGAINLEALDELDQLEARFEKLSGQYRDLVDAKASLERITQRINIDSRQLFLSTLETVRGHFQELFRRLFGGGEADIIVDEAEDVLECGIEIVARPPGKEACSISLLSGGEKTLTCVALLLAVFRSKPSPFCILDEVDAALDEANIGRFTAVLARVSLVHAVHRDHAFEEDDVRRGHASTASRWKSRAFRSAFRFVSKTSPKMATSFRAPFFTRGNSRKLPWQSSMPSHRQVRRRCRLASDVFRRCGRVQSTQCELRSCLLSCWTATSRGAQHSERPLHRQKRRRIPLLPHTTIETF